MGWPPLEEAMTSSKRGSGAKNKKMCLIVVHLASPCDISRGGPLLEEGMIFSKGGSGARTKKNVPHYCSFSIPLGEVLCSMCIIHLGSSRHFFWGGCDHCLLFCPLFLATQTPCLKWPVLLPVPLSFLPVACCCLGPLILAEGAKVCLGLHGGLERLSPSPLFPPVLLEATGALGLTR